MVIAMIVVAIGIITIFDLRPDVFHCLSSDDHIVDFLKNFRPEPHPVPRHHVWIEWLRLRESLQPDEVLQIRIHRDVRCRHLV
ncbi:MAG: hypothetical protein BWY82_02300 [Verrucomicrobia bacterium ADurb.Bin474]|nr:MAG: hypothetical protein BWY82_02300 [Verrucomicrobia bacterium ADurb.Bin474]